MKWIMEGVSARTDGQGKRETASSQMLSGGVSAHGKFNATHAQEVRTNSSDVVPKRSFPETFADDGEARA